MTVSRYATQAGKKYERDLLQHFRNFGFDVERLRLSGAEDEGDLLVRAKNGDRFVIEAKREQGFKLGPWLKEAIAEADNYAKHRELIAPPGFLVVHHAKGKGIGQSFVTTTLNEFMGWIG